MSINSISNNAASWAQFVKITQAARVRNDGLAAEGVKAAQAVSNPQMTDTVSFKRVADVYSNNIAALSDGQYSVRAEVQPEANRRVVGGVFDAYA